MFTDKLITETNKPAIAITIAYVTRVFFMLFPPSSSLSIHPKNCITMICEKQHKREIRPNYFRIFYLIINIF